MLRIAIVDDEQQIREELCAMVSRFVDENGASLHVDCYAGGREFLESGATEDIVFLDIEMGEPDGMETARLMRRAGLASEIIFVTNMAQYAVEGYEVRALDFIVKPVRYQSFAFKLRRAIDVASRKKTARIELETREGLRRVSTSDIDYVEVVRHKLLYHTSRGVLEVWGTMREACERLEPFGFSLCNACYLVNLEHVTAISGEFVTVRCGDELKMSRGRKKSFVDALTHPTGG